MRLNLVTKLEQQQTLAPQMILSMDILLLNSLDLESRIERLDDTSATIIRDKEDLGDHIVALQTGHSESRDDLSSLRAML